MTPERFKELNERGVIPMDPAERAAFMDIRMQSKREKAGAKATATKKARYNAWPGAANTHRTLRGDGTCPPSPTNR